uniref:Uncharacterized protein n=1 Tax=Manihot esculenta TaxID=3983 RepID=A0A2C9V2B8_MANES
MNFSFYEFVEVQQMTFIQNCKVIFLETGRECCFQ